MKQFLRTITVLATTAAMAAAMTMLGSGTAHASQTGEVDFTSPGTYQWTAPAGVDAAQIVLRGAAGGNNVALDGTISSGGNGGLVQATFSLIAGQTYSVVVGGLGGSATDGTTDSSGGPGGYGGGGNGASAGGGCHPSGGGGGATSFSVASSGTPLLVAGGGGGARTGVTGGAGNYPTGDPGPSIFGNPADAAGGGRQDAGGIPGFDAATGSYDFARNGSAQLGGSGGSDNCTGGGGGGGGWFGGGGGSGANSGGGGSSYLSPSVDVYNAGASSIRTSGSVNLFYGSAVAPSPIVAPTQQLTAGQAAAFQYAATGWPQPLIVATGAIPDGLSIGSDGTVTGTPTKAGAFNVTLNAYNVAGLTSWVQEIDVVAGYPTKVSVSPTSDSTVAGTYFGHDPVAHVTDNYGNAAAGCLVQFVDTDGLVTFESAAPNSPSAINVVTDANGDADPGRVLAGSTPGTAQISLRCGKVGTAASYTVVAANAAPRFVPATPPAAQVGHTFVYRYLTEGSPQPTVTLASGTLPKGLHLAATGRLSGTPTVARTYRFTLQASNGIGTPATLGQSITVQPAAILSVGATSANERDAGTRNRTITIALSNPSISDVTVHWATSDGSATAGSDYIAKSGTVKMLAGQRSVTITVPVVGDTVPEGDETFLVLLDHATNATIGTAFAVQTIIDDDTAAS